MVVEIVFAAGIALAISSRSSRCATWSRCCPIITSLGLFLTPVIWPYSKIPTNYHIAGGRHVHTVIQARPRRAPAHMVGGFTINLQIVYGFFNPLGPVIDSARRTMLLGSTPTGRSWSARPPRGDCST